MRSAHRILHQGLWAVGQANVQSTSVLHFCDAPRKKINCNCLHTNFEVGCLCFMHNSRPRGNIGYQLATSVQNISYVVDNLEASHANVHCASALHRTSGSMHGHFKLVRFVEPDGNYICSMHDNCPCDEITNQLTSTIQHIKFAD